MHMCTEEEGVSKEKVTGGFVGLNRDSRLAWGLIQDEFYPDNPPPFFAPYTYMQLIPYTADRVRWQGIVDLPTSKELSTEE